MAPYSSRRGKDERAVQAVRSFAIGFVLALAGAPGFEPVPVLASQQTDTVAAALLDHPDLGTFAQLLQEAGLLEEFRGPGTRTLFAPTDEAFEPYRDGRLEELRSRPQQLERFIRRHLIDNDIIIGSGGRLTSNGSLNPIDDVLWWPE